MVSVPCSTHQADLRGVWVDPADGSDPDTLYLRGFCRFCGGPVDLTVFLTADNALCGEQSDPRVSL